jgi:hypothetical protein
MIRLRPWLALLLLVSVTISCKSKKVSLSGDEPVEVGDFMDFFPEVSLPFMVADSNLLKKEKDSLLISVKVFNQFVPDSVLRKIFGKSAQPKIYPMGKVKGDETYLFVKAMAASNRSALAVCFDRKNQFIAAIPFLTLDQSSSTQQAGSFDKGYALTKSIYRKNSDGTISEGKDVYVLNKEARDFMLIMTDALDDKVSELTNPIDTMSRKQKYTADYGSGKQNLFSFRDGRKNDRLSFFIHFEKNNGECTGELKGEAIIKSPSVAEYREGGDPCVLQFIFNSSSVTVKELGGCGSRRGLRCSFDGVYPRKKEAKSKAVKSKKKGVK